MENSSRKINKEDLSAKIKEYFSNKLDTLEMKFKLDMKIIKPYKYEYVELYHNLEDLQTEILNFIDGKDDQNNINNTISEKPQVINLKTPIQNLPNISSTIDVDKNASAKPFDRKKSILVNGTSNNNSTLNSSTTNKNDALNSTSRNNLTKGDNLNIKKKEVTINVNSNKLNTSMKTKNAVEESSGNSSTPIKKKEIVNKDKEKEKDKALDKEKVVDKSINNTTINSGKKKNIINPNNEIKNIKNGISTSGNNNDKKENLKTKPGTNSNNKSTIRTSSVPKKDEKLLENADTAKKNLSTSKNNDNNLNEKILENKEDENEDGNIVSNFIVEKQEENKEESNIEEKLENNQEKNEEKQEEVFINTEKEKYKLEDNMLILNNKSENNQEGEEKENEIINENKSDENNKLLNEENQSKLDKKYIESKIKELNELINKYLKNDAAQIIIKKKLIISKSAISALNLIKPKEELEHIKKATSDKQSDILRLILLYLNEDYSNIEQDKISEYFLENIFKKYNVENMSIFIIIFLYFLLKY
jgi:hypothetical protein